MFIKSLVTVKCITIKKLYYEADYFIHCIHIYYNDVHICTEFKFFSNNKSQRWKNSEQILENNKDQFGISSKGIFGKLIKGIVYDAGTREPIIGANVVELGTSNGTVTDIDGQYSLRVSNASQKILVASYIGYVTQAQKIGVHEVVNFFLVEDTQTLQK